MSELTNMCENTNAGIAILKILCAKENKEVMDSLPMIPNVEVEITVNGKPVSWKKTVAELMDIRQQELNQKVAAKLDSIISLDGVRNLLYDLETIKYSLREKIEKLAGEKIEWTEDY